MGIDYETDGAVLGDADYSADWKDSNRYRLGLEYRPDRGWSVRSGYFFDESLVPDKSVGFSNISCVNRHNVSFGLGHQGHDRWHVDLLYQYSWGDGRANEVDYSQRIHSLGLSVSCEF
jgi:long-subunit fatty acid transport protein